MASKSSTSSKDGPIDSVLTALARIAEGMGQIDAALTIYDLALNVNPNGTTALSNRALIYLMKNQEDKAQKDMNKACTKAPKDQVALRTRAFASFVTGNKDAAARDMKKALEANEWDALTVLLAYPVIDQTGTQQDSFQLLADAIDNKKIKSQDWPVPVLQCLKGDITVTDLLPQASTPAKLLESRAYIGFVKAFGSDPQAGKADLLYVFGQRSGSPLVRVMASRGLKVIQEGYASDVAARQERADRISGVDFMG